MVSQLQDNNKLKETYLLISNNENTTYKTTNLTKWKVYDILIKRKLKSYKHIPTLVDKLWNFNFKNLLNVWKVNILFSNDWLMFKYLNIPENTKNQLWEYIRNKDAIKWSLFECSAFVHFLSWAPIREEWICLDENMWEYQDSHIKILSSWDIIFIWEISKLNLKNWNYHWAYYLWEWLFIHKYDKMNWFVITDLTALKEMQWTKKIIKMIPRFKANYENSIEDYVIKSVS